MATPSGRTSAVLSSTVVLGNLPAYLPGAMTQLLLPHHPLPTPLGAPPHPSAGAPVFPLVVGGANGSSAGVLQHTAEGIDSSQCGCAPPDVQVAVGPTQELEMVNQEGQLFGPAGTSERTFSLSSFFGTGSGFISDPKVLFDSPSGHWFASILVITSSNVGLTRVAASSTSDPNGTWHVYTVAMPSGTFGDQPILGVSLGAISVSGDVISLSTSAFDGAAYWLLNKTEAMNGSASVSMDQFGPDVGAASLHPVQSITPSPDLYVTMTNYGGSLSYIELYDVAGVPPATVTVTRTNLSVASIQPAPSAVQPGTTDASDTGDSRVLTAVWSQGSLWLGFNVQCQLSTDSSARACVRLVEINTSLLSVQEDFDVSLQGAYLYYPAITVSASGVVAVLMGGSSSTIYPSLLVTTRLPADAPSTLQPALWVEKGSAAQTCGGVCRYGDYFGGGVVPGTESGWFAGEYGGPNATWQTRLAEVGWLGPLNLRVTVNTTSLEVGQSAMASITLLNSTCHGGVYCFPHIPLGPQTYQPGCVTNFTGATLPLTFLAAGDFILGQGGWVAMYGSSFCGPGTPISNVSAPGVTVHVVPAVHVAVTSSPSSVADEGQAIGFQAAVSGGVAPFTYHWSGLPAGCVDSGQATVDCIASGAGPLNVRVDVVDGYSVHTAGAIAFWVYPAPTVTVAAAETTLEAGGILALTATVEGGSGTYSMVWTGLPTDCPTQNSTFLSCRPTETGGFTVIANATDSPGLSVLSRPLALLIVTPVTVQLSVTGAPVTVGGAVVLTASISGGQEPYSVEWTGLPPGCASANSSALHCQPNAQGTFLIRATVVDGLGGVANATVPLPVAPAASTGLSFPLLSAGVLVIAGVVLAVVLLIARSRRRRKRVPVSPGAQPPRA
ncbi:MAG TPA: hypothetical protein VFG07_07865 [Thermoplasmata archaeon]|nr:hypothetical protein [Thermoplasmata archaeon]